MVFATLRKGHRAPAVFSPGAASYFDPKSPEQKRREKERLKHRDLGFGLLNSPGGGANEDEDDETSDGEKSQAHHNAYAPLNVQELEQSIHSRLSYHSKTSGSSSGERSRAAPLPQSLQQELDDFGSLLNRHATGASTTQPPNHPKAPSKWGRPIKDPSTKSSLFPTLQPSSRDLLGVNSSHHQRGIRLNETNASGESNNPSPVKRSAAQNTAIGQNRASPPKEKPMVHTNAAGSESFFVENRKSQIDFPSQHSRKAASIPRNMGASDFPSQHSRSGPSAEDRKKNKAAPKEATITRRRMTRKNTLLSHSEDEHSNDDSFFDDPTKWNGSPRRRRVDSEDPSLTDGGESDVFAAGTMPYNTSSHQRSPARNDPFQERASADPTYSSPQRKSPNATMSAPTPGTSLTTKNFVALEQGDWASLMDTNPMLIKSPEGKLRPTIHDPKSKKKDAAQQMATCRSLSGGSSSSEDDSVSSRNTRDTGFFSEDELELEIYSSDEDDGEVPSVLKEMHASNVSLDIPESPEVRRQVARMTSGQLRRWDGFHLQVVALVKIALPDQVGQVSALMKRFAGREAELIQTLQTMCRRLETAPSSAKKQSIHHSRGLISRTDAQSPRRISAIAGRKIDAIARIAAANTLDDQTRAVKPEYVVDDGDQSFWQNSKSGSSLNGSSLLNSEDMEDSESSYSEAPYEYEENNRRSAYSEYDDDEEDGFESYGEEDEEDGSDYEDNNYDEGDDYEQDDDEEEEAYAPSEDDDSSSSEFR